MEIEAKVGTKSCRFYRDLQGRRNVFITGQAKLDHEDYAIKCMDA